MPSNTHNKLIDDCAPTPRYVTFDESAPTFDYVIVGGGVVGQTAALKLADAYPNCSILIVEASKGDSDHLRVLPLNVALRSEQNELVNRALTEWTAQLVQLPVVPQVPQLLTSPLPDSAALFSLTAHYKVVDSTEKDLCTVAEDLAYWRDIQMRSTPECEPPTSKIRQTTALMRQLDSKPKVILLSGTDVTMINYKQKMIGTRKFRVKFEKCVFYAASLKNLIPDINQNGDSQPAIRFYPPLPRDILDQTAILNYVPIERTQLSFEEPFWQKRMDFQDLFYMTVPLKSNALARCMVMDDKRSIEVCYTANAPCCNRRMGKNVYDEANALLLALSGIFECGFLVDEHALNADPKSHKHHVKLTGVRQLSAKSTYQKSAMVKPDSKPLFESLRTFHHVNGRSDLVFMNGCTNIGALIREDTSSLASVLEE